MFRIKFWPFGAVLFAFAWYYRRAFHAAVAEQDDLRIFLQGPSTNPDDQEIVIRRNSWHYCAANLLIDGGGSYDLRTPDHVRFLFIKNMGDPFPKKQIR
jgi:hypothetical protein